MMIILPLSTQLIPHLFVYKPQKSSFSIGGAVLHHLLEWVQSGDADKYVKDLLQQSNPHDSPSYWPAVSDRY